jgi:acylphosphatase
VKIKEEIIIEGPCVHDVGYRFHILHYARRHGIRRFFAFNTESEGMQQVVIQIEDTEETVRAFLDFLAASQPDGAQVSNITHTPYDQEVWEIGEFRQDLILDLLTRGLNALQKMKDSSKDGEGSEYRVDPSLFRL